MIRIAYTLSILFVVETRTSEAMQWLNWSICQFPSAISVIGSIEWLKIESYSGWGEVDGTIMVLVVIFNEETTKKMVPSYIWIR